MVDVLSRGQVQLLLTDINLVVDNDRSDDFPDVLFVSHSLENSGYPRQLAVRGVVIPADCRYGIFWLEEISYWGVVHNNDVSHWSAESR